MTSRVSHNQTLIRHQILMYVVAVLCGVSVLAFVQVGQRVLDERQTYLVQVAMLGELERTTATVETNLLPWALAVKLRRILPELMRTQTPVFGLQNRLAELEQLLQSPSPEQRQASLRLLGCVAALRTELARVYDSLLERAQNPSDRSLALRDLLTAAAVTLLGFLCCLVLLLLRARRQSDEEGQIWLAPGLDRLVFQQSPAGMLLCDQNEIVRAANPAYCRLSGFGDAELIGQHQAVHQAGGWGASKTQQMRDALYASGCWQGSLWLRKKSGEAFSLRVARIALLDGARKIHGFLTLSLEPAAGDEAQRLMVWQAHHDTLTKLPNMNLFTERVSRGLSRAMSEGGEGALLSINLDSFAALNDSLGYAFGDRILMEVGHRISVVVREQDTVARLGGDSFGVLLQSLAGTAEAARLAHELLEAIGAPLELDERRLFVSASIGVTMFPAADDTIGSIVQRADAARAEAKNAGGAQFAFFEQAMNERAVRRLELESELRKALAEGQFSLSYQPIVDLQAKRIATFEGLLRWQHPALGRISPAEFIPVAEESGLIVEIGLWVVNEALAQLRKLASNGFPNIRLSINISTRQLREVSDVCALIAELRVPETQRLTIEITESLLVADMDLNQEFLNQARALGARVALDDFGTGFSSLSYLRDYKFDLLKIDRSFVSGLNHSSAEKDLVASIISLGDILGLDVVAEGVEEVDELSCLSDMGCSLIQGYYFAEPMAAEAVVGYLRAGELRKAS